MNLVRRPVPGTPDLSEELHPVLRRIYAARGVGCDADLDLSLSKLLSPQGLANMDEAVQLLHRSLQAREKILVVGDFDADGATSCALALLCLRAMGAKRVDYLVPNRFEYGYGLTPEIVQVARERQPDLIITVDNGIASHQGVAAAKALGIKVLVTDHHLPGDSLPEADSIINPNLPGCGFESKALAGVGVVFYLMLALRTHLRERRWFEEEGIPEPNMLQFLDLVALGTVADVVPLDHNNRILVHNGLQQIQSGRTRPGIIALLEVAGRSLRHGVAADLGFAVGPRLNAAGRLDDMSLGIECLLAEEPQRAWEMARELDNLNQDRKSIEREMQEQALSYLDKLAPEGDGGHLGICLYEESWHQGVIGILASRIKDKFHRPVIAFADAGVNQQGEAEIKGSARSIPGLHIRDALDAVATEYPDLLSKFGGHAMAAGLSILKKDFKDFARIFEQCLARLLDEDILENITHTDGVLNGDCLCLNFARRLRQAGPWGQGFPEPLFEGSFQVLEQKVLADKHLKLRLQPLPEGEPITGLAFNMDFSVWPQQVSTITVTYRLDVNEFRGRLSAQLLIEGIVEVRP